jgi:hypothetical protein
MPTIGADAARLNETMRLVRTHNTGKSGFL